MISEFNSLIGSLKTSEFRCDDTYYQIADRLGVPYKTQPVVCVKNDKPILRKDWGKEIGMDSGNVKFVQIPRGETIKNILKTIALIGLSIFAPYVGAFFGGGILGAFASAAFVLGGTFLINAFLGPKSPSMQTSRSASPTYSLDAQGNQARILNPIPRLYGTHIIYPDFASQPYNSYENNEQYLFQLLCLGVGDYRVDKINIDKTELWDRVTGLSSSFSDVELEIVPPGQKVTLFPSNVVTSTEISGQELRNESFTASCTFSGNRVTFGSKQSIIEFLSPGDVITITGAGANNGSYPITDKDTVDALTWIEFGTTFTTIGSSVSKTFTLDNWIGPIVANPNNEGTDLLKVDIALNRGLYYANDEGGLSNASVSYQIQARRIDNFGDPIGVWTTLLNETITKRTLTPQRYTKKFNVTRGRYEVRMRRTDQKRHDSRHGNELSWGALRAFIPDDNIFADVTLLAMKIRASNQLTSQSSTQINVIQTAKIPVWNGTTWSAPVVSNNPAWVAADILRNNVYGAGIADSRIDLVKLLELSSIYAARGDSFNGIFDTTRTLWEALTSVLTVVRSQPILIAGKITFVRDQPRALARTVITPQSILKNTFEMTHVLKGEDSADDVIVEFMDSKTWERSEVQATLPNSTSTNPARIEMFGVTNRSQAWREGMYYAASNSYRRIFAAVSTECDGRLLLKGDPVIISHDVPQWSQNGYIMDYLSTEKVLILDRNINFADNNNIIILRRKDGKEFGPINVLTNGYSNEIVLESGSLSAIEIAQGITIDEVLSIDDEAKRTTFVFAGGGDQFVKRFIVIGSTIRDFNKVDLELVIDDSRVYDADTGDAPPGVDYLGPGVTPNGPVVPTIYVNQSPMSGSDPVTLVVAWDLAVGATQYILQYSSDGTTWENIYTGTALNTSIVVNAGDVYLRVAGVGLNLGPWKEFNGSFGTLSLLPGIVTNVNVLADTTGGTLEVSFDSAPRATTYTASVYIESSYGSGNFDTLKLTKTTASTFISWTSSDVTTVGGPWGRIEVRIMANNTNGSGTIVSAQVLDVSLGTINNLSLIDFYNGEEANIQWSSLNGAAGYRVKIYNNVNTLVRETVVSSPTYFYNNSKLVANGGPWRAFSVKVNGESSALTGPQSTLNITDPAPPAPSNIVATNPSSGILNITWDSVPDTDVISYRVHYSTTSGFTPGPSNVLYEGASLGVSATGVPANTYYFRVMARDSYKGNDGYNYSAQQMITVT